MNKKELRSKFIKVRESITEKEEKSKIIANKLLSFDALKGANIISIYVSMENEVNTLDIINNLLIEGKKVCVPLTKEDGTMKFVLIDSLENMTVNKFGTLEPNNVKMIVKPQDINVMIMPGICFDRYGNRIGFGKGYYDRYLECITPIKIAIAFSEQVINEKIKEEKFDIKYDYLITEKETINAIKTL